MTTRKVAYHGHIWKALVEQGWITQHVEEGRCNGKPIRLAIMVKGNQ